VLKWEVSKSRVEEIRDVEGSSYLSGSSIQRTLFGRMDKKRSEKSVRDYTTLLLQRERAE
jgi:hypothetical protein